MPKAMGGLAPRNQYEPGLRCRAAVAAAKAGLKAGGWARSQLGDFDRVLAQETGITLGQAARRTYHAGKWTAQQTIKAARTAAPYAKEYGAKAVDWVRTGIRERIARSGDRMSFDKASTA